MQVSNLVFIVFHQARLQGNVSQICYLCLGSIFMTKDRKIFDTFGKNHVLNNIIYKLRPKIKV